MGSQLITGLICRDNQLIYTYVHTSRQFRVISQTLPGLEVRRAWKPTPTQRERVAFTQNKDKLSDMWS